MTGPLRRWRRRTAALGHRRIRVALLLAALAATVFTALTSLPAYAQPPTPSTSPDTSSTAPALPAPGVPPGQRPPTQEEIEQIQKTLQEQNEVLSKSAQEAYRKKKIEQLKKLLPEQGGVLSVFNVTDANGMPISAYNVSSDTGGITDWQLGLENFFTEIAFLVTKWVVAFACWLISWSLSFGLAKLLLAPAAAVSQSLHTHVLMDMGIPSLFLTTCALICTCRIFFGNRASGWSDAAISIVLAALTTTLLVSVPQTLLGSHGALATVRGLSLDVADIILDADPTSPHSSVVTPATADQLSRPLTDSLTDAFIVKPAMLLQYGQLFSGTCAKAYSTSKLSQLAYEQEVSDRAHHLKDDVFGIVEYIDPGGTVSNVYDTELDMAIQWATDHFGDPPMQKFEKKCVKGDINAAKKASLDKLGGGIFLLVAAVIVCVLIVALAGQFQIAQVRIAWDSVRGEAILYAGTIPGAGRAALWNWTSSVFRSLTEVLWSVVALAIFITFIVALLKPNSSWGDELTIRFLVIDILCIGAIVKRKTIKTRSRELAGNLRTKLNSSPRGGTHGSIFASPSTQPAVKSPRIARATARGLIRTAMVGATLAAGQPLTALAYALPSQLGAATLMSRVNTARRTQQRRRRARPAGRPRPRPAPATAPTTPQPAPTPPPPPAPPRPTTPPPRPTHRPGSYSARSRRVAATATPSRTTPSAATPPQPAATAGQQRLRQRLDRASRHRTPPRRRP